MVLTPLTPVTASAAVPATTRPEEIEEDDQRRSVSKRLSLQQQQHNKTRTPNVTPDLLHHGGLNELFRLLKCHYIHMGFLDFCDCSRFMKALCEAAVTSENGR